MIIQPQPRQLCRRIHLRQLLPLHTAAFYLVDTDSAEFLLEDCDPPDQRAAVDPMQPDLFAQDFSVEAPEAEPHPVVEQLAAIDPDRLTPREALDLLYVLKKLAG